MATKITLSVPDGLKAKMDKWKGQFNYSKICQEAIERAIGKKERFLEKAAQKRSVQEIMARGDFSTEEGQYAVGKELGFHYAEKAPYRTIKAFEHYVEPYKAGDAEAIEQFHYDLDLFPLVVGMGAFTIEEEGKLPEDTEKAMPLSGKFDRGFMDGVIEFMKEESESIEVSRIAFKRNKELAVTKDKNERLRIIEKWMPEFERVMGPLTTKDKGKEVTSHGKHLPKR
jgi:hypothetical protein